MLLQRLPHQLFRRLWLTANWNVSMVRGYAGIQTRQSSRGRFLGGGLLLDFLFKRRYGPPLSLWETTTVVVPGVRSSWLSLCPCLAPPWPGPLHRPASARQARPWPACSPPADRCGSVPWRRPAALSAGLSAGGACLTFSALFSAGLPAGFSTFGAGVSTFGAGRLDLRRRRLHFGAGFASDGETAGGLAARWPAHEQSSPHWPPTRCRTLLSASARRPSCPARRC